MYLDTSTGKEASHSIRSVSAPQASELPTYHAHHTSMLPFPSSSPLQSIPLCNPSFSVTDPGTGFTDAPPLPSSARHDHKQHNTNNTSSNNGSNMHIHITNTRKWGTTHSSPPEYYFDLSCLCVALLAQLIEQEHPACATCKTAMFPIPQQHIGITLCVAELC